MIPAIGRSRNDEGEVECVVSPRRGFFIWGALFPALTRWANLFRPDGAWLRSETHRRGELQARKGSFRSSQVSIYWCAVRARDMGAAEP
jgi:hypothetical protein